MGKSPYILIERIQRGRMCEPAWYKLAASESRFLIAALDAVQVQSPGASIPCRLESEAALPDFYALTSGEAAWDV